MQRSSVISKALALAVIVAVAIGVGSLWARDDRDATSRDVADESRSEDRARSATKRALHTAVRPVRLTEVADLRSLEPTAEEPRVRELQEWLIARLDLFYARASLTSDQRERFETDLWDVAETEWSAYLAGPRDGFDGLPELREASEHELLSRAESYLDAQQLAVLRRIDPLTLIANVRAGYLAQRPSVPRI
jgi:hypothetical protein